MLIIGQLRVLLPVNSLRPRLVEEPLSQTSPSQSEKRAPECTMSGTAAHSSLAGSTHKAHPTKGEARLALLVAIISQNHLVGRQVTPVCVCLTS